MSWIRQQVLLCTTTSVWAKVSLNVRSVYSVTLLIIGLCTPKWNIRVQNIARGIEEPFFMGGGGGWRGERTKINPGNTIIGF